MAKRKRVAVSDVVFSDLIEAVQRGEPSVRALLDQHCRQPYFPDLLEKARVMLATKSVLKSGRPIPDSDDRDCH